MMVGSTMVNGEMVFNMELEFKSILKEKKRNAPGKMVTLKVGFDLFKYINIKYLFSFHSYCKSNVFPLTEISNCLGTPEL
jgi:hypothetical protein